MRQMALVFLLLAVVIFPITCHADTIEYQFSFTNLSNGDANFTLDITTNGFITVTGLEPLPTSLPTSLGYSVNNFGADKFGEFGFSESGGIVTDMGTYFSLTTFQFLPYVRPPSGYFQTPGVFAGGVEGNPLGFRGDATLTISDLTVSQPVPEPSTIALLGTGLLGLACAGRRRLLRL